MKTVPLAIASALIVGAASLFWTPASIAQQEGQTDTNVETPQRPTSHLHRQANRPDADQQLGQLDTKTSGANIRASKLIGKNLENAQGENIGEINDLVIDGNSGKIKYVAVTYGGFLGMGEKMFAVPFEAFKVRPQQGDPNDYVLTLEVTKQQLKGAQGFDDEHWPNFADRRFTSEIDRRYNVRRSALRPQNPEARNNGVNENDTEDTVPERR